MIMNSHWDLAVAAALHQAMAKYRLQLSHTDRWKQAIACCITAQTIRVKRRSNTHQSSHIQAQPLESWNMAIQREVDEVRRMAARSNDLWKCSLKTKVQAWKMRHEELQNCHTFDPATLCDS
jgi:hypothetical protein